MITDNTSILGTGILQNRQKISRANRKMVQLADKDIHDILSELADLTLEQMDFILMKNQKDWG